MSGTEICLRVALSAVVVGLATPFVGVATIENETAQRVCWTVFCGAIAVLVAAGVGLIWTAGV